jgi:hypothetical protein
VGGGESRITISSTLLALSFSSSIFTHAAFCRGNKKIQNSNMRICRRWQRCSV